MTPLLPITRPIRYRPDFGPEDHSNWYLHDRPRVCQCLLHPDGRIARCAACQTMGAETLLRLERRTWFRGQPDREVTHRVGVDVRRLLQTGTTVVVVLTTPRGRSSGELRSIAADDGERPITLDEFAVLCDELERSSGELRWVQRVPRILRAICTKDGALKPESRVILRSIQPPRHGFGDAWDIAHAVMCSRFDSLDLAGLWSAPAGGRCPREIVASLHESRRRFFALALWRSAGPWPTHRHDPPAPLCHHVNKLNPAASLQTCLQLARFLVAGRSDLHRPFAIDSVHLLKTLGRPDVQAAARSFWQTYESRMWWSEPKRWQRALRAAKKTIAKARAARADCSPRGSTYGCRVSLTVDTFGRARYGSRCPMSTLQEYEATERRLPDGRYTYVERITYGRGRLHVGPHVSTGWIEDTW